MTGVRAFLSRFMWVQFAAMVLLLAAGSLALASAGEARGGAVMAGKWKDALATAAFAFAAYFAIASVDYRKLLRLFALPGYIFSVVLLVLVLVAGSEQFGGKRWLWFFQPAEVAKLCLVAFIAWFWGGDREKDRWRFGFAGFAFAVAVAGIPCVLILVEPDLGSVMALAPACLAMLLCAGVWRKGLLALLAAAAVSAAAVLGAVHEAYRPGTPPEKTAAIMRYVPLRRHQAMRVKTFLFPESDPLGAGYNLRQSKMALGSGGARGKGWRRGESVRRRLLPPMGVMNDFIFCVWAEETGFAGSAALIALYALLCASTARAAIVARDGSGRLLALGMATLVFAHVYVNTGMTVGLVPITGLPLPFMSLGRTFLATTVLGLGLVQSVSIHREE